ncbi:hypothetical protein IQ06DRAFT_286491 [Phaeosphaeriaceae sp. SRC1lsM3a]|nr:hypothetical protein IQ06DRAFT_286491 [Stagonospora sp. SRC1lsM3a]
MPLDLSLPRHAPELCQYGNYNWDEAAFAIYTLLGPTVPRSSVASVLNQRWLEQGNEDSLTRPAPELTAQVQTLKDAVLAHISLDKGICPRTDGGAAGDLEWWPTAFIVVVSEDWQSVDGGLLFVYVDEERGGEVGMFGLKVRHASEMLECLRFGDEEVGEGREAYGCVPQA